MKTGQQHIAGLRDGRAVFIDGKRVDDTTRHPAFRNAIQSVGKLFDFAADEANRELMTFATPTGGRANRIWQLPETFEELRQRRTALEEWGGLHAGFLGRAPDHVASCIAGMYMGLDQFEAYDKDRAKALADYYTYARDRDLYLTYVIINPQADRSKSAAQQKDAFLTTGVVDQDAEGITVRGAKMLATGGIMADEVFVTCIQPLQPGDEPYALSFAIPMNAKGLQILSRKSYEASSQSVFDNPLSSRFDENDAVLYFDSVPWDRIFVYKNLEMCQKQFHATPAHVYQNYQAMVRLSVKVRFLIGMARRIAETNGVLGFPQVRETLGQLAAEGGMIDAFVAAMEIKGTKYGRYYVPDRHTLYEPHPTAVFQDPQHAARARRWRHDHVAVLGAGSRQSGDRRAGREDPAVAGGGRARQGQVLQAGLGRGRLGIRLAASAVRDVLRGGDLRHQEPFVPHLRLGRRRRPRHQHAVQLRARRRAENLASRLIRSAPCQSTRSTTSSGRST